MSSDSSIYYPPWCSQLLTLSPCSLIFWRFLLLTQCHILQHHFITILGEVCRSEPAAAAESLHSCPTLCDPIDDSPPGSPVPAILQARTLEWVAISFSNAWKWKVKVKLLSRVLVSSKYCRLCGPRDKTTCLYNREENSCLPHPPFLELRIHCLHLEHFTQRPYPPTSLTS